jgi:hypothetical protein
MSSANSLLNFNFGEEHVQPAIKNADGFITSESQVIGFGPPTVDQIVAGSGLAQTLNAFDIPVVLAGVVENYSWAQGQQVIKIYEIGSVLSYTIASRADGQVSLNRVLLNNQSLMRMMYAAYGATNGTFKPLIGVGSPGVQLIDAGNTLPGTVNPDDDGNRDFFFNMNHPLFRNTFGSIIFLEDTKKRAYGAVYFENSLVSSHGIAVSSGGLIVQEAAAFRYTRAVPVRVSGLLSLLA